MSKLMVLVIVLVACEPAPGETRCTTSLVYGNAITSCNQGPPIQPVEQQNGWWCWTRPVDNIGVCHRVIGDCQASRMTSSSAGPSYTAGDCQYFANAVCADSGCGPNIESCSMFERDAKRGPNACSMTR